MPPDNKNTFRVSIGGRVERGGGPFNIRGKGLGLIGFSVFELGRRITSGDHKSAANAEPLPV